MDKIQEDKAEKTITEHQKYVLSEIIKHTGDKKSRLYWIKALKELGSNAVAEDLGTTKHEMRMKHIKKPAAYLTKLLEERRKLKSPAAEKKPLKKLNTFFPDTQAELFNNMVPIVISKDEKGIAGNMEVPYSGKNIPWTTFIGPDFFTLSTNKKKSDKVKAVFHFRNDEKAEVTLIRGKLSASDPEEKGILTIQHQKVLAALKLEWAKQGCLKMGKLCYVDYNAKELAKVLGWQKFGGRQLNRIKNLIHALKSKPYCFDFKNSNVKGIKNYYFYLIDGFSGFDKLEKGKKTSYFRVTFSAAISYELLNRQAVIRPKHILQIKSELAALLWLYLEPNLRSRGVACINLSNLVKVLNLPEASWHKDKHHRKQQFEKAVKAINGKELADNRIMIVKIEKGLYDWQLVAHLKGYSIKLPGETQPGN